MPSRIRIYATHPQYGQFVGPEAKRQIIALNLRSPSLRFEFKNTAKYVKQLGEEAGWTVRLFRVPKGVKLAKTEWGRFLASVGLFPFLPKKNVKAQVKPQAVPAPPRANDFDAMIQRWLPVQQQQEIQQQVQQPIYVLPNWGQGLGGNLPIQNQVGYRFQYQWMNANGAGLPGAIPGEMVPVQNNPADEFVPVPPPNHEPLDDPMRWLDEHIFDEEPPI